MHLRSLSVLCATTALALVLQGCGADSPPTASPTAPSVAVIVMAPETLETSQQLAGRAVASEISQVRPQVGGVITEQMFREGTQVQAGDPLYQIDPTLYQASVDQASANVALAQASLQSTRRQAERYAGLIKVEGVSQQEFDDAQAAYQQAQATVAASQATLATARTNLRYTTIVAPISGRIGRSSVTRGALVTADQEDALVTIHKLDPMYVDMTQSSDQYLAVRQQLADMDDTVMLPVRLQSSQGTPIAQTGLLTFSDIAVDQATGTVLLRATFPNADQTLLPGMYVRARLVTGQQDQALLVPQNAIVRQMDGAPTVWVISAEDTAEQRPVDLGPAVGNRWQVIGGLAAGERVVVEGLQSIRDSQPVTVIATRAWPAQQATTSSAVATAQ